MPEFIEEFLSLVFSCSNDGDCNNHGMCQNGTCNCIPGWDIQVDCSGKFLKCQEKSSISNNIKKYCNPANTSQTL